MATTHNVVLVKDPRNKKQGYLKLRSITNRKPSDKSLGIKIQIKNWNAEKQVVYSKEPDSDKINDRIQKVLLEARGGKVDFLNLKRGNKSVIAYAEKVIDVISSRNTRRGRRDALNKFKEYLQTINKDDIEFSDIDIFLVRGYYSFLIDSGLAYSTANEYITVLRYLVNQGVENGLHVYAQDPFKGLKKKKSIKRYRVLNEEELKIFMEYEPSRKSTLLVQKSFLFMMYAAGIRISDALLLQWKNIQKVNDSYFLQYRIQKTGTVMETKLTIEALVQLRVFLQEYDEGFGEKADYLDQTSKEIKSRLRILQSDHDLIKILSFQELKEEYENENENSGDFEDLVIREQEKEMEKEELQHRINSQKRNLELINRARLEHYGNKIMELRAAHPEDTILPYMRGFYRGEQSLNTDLHNKSHVLKNTFNYHLKLIQTACEINTGISNHQARHIFSQRLFLSGANFHYISMALGHSTLQVTENYREKLVTDEAKDVTQLFSDTFSS
ncbi:tyrosine-type recombinase/integrase [Salinimicrobium xinjiangense]|uniref:tyrosine-type recombinase/integrase n=1 Tax=Salinimicrobium xinjiangense TaxID=438596 RepID=UPI000410874E|nr:tyrosine-type recombinase/integrase [Salinimicrobium xinjiangense]